jgi:hypothetical protein
MNMETSENPRALPVPGPLRIGAKKVADRCGQKIKRWQPRRKLLARAVHNVKGTKRC